jgi:hypothetical protein
VLILAWTNEIHGLIYNNIRLDTSGPFLMLALTLGVWSWVDEEIDQLWKKQI